MGPRPSGDSVEVVSPECPAARRAETRSARKDRQRANPRPHTPCRAGIHRLRNNSLLYVGVTSIGPTARMRLCFECASVRMPRICIIRFAPSCLRCATVVPKGDAAAYSDTGRSRRRLRNNQPAWPEVPVPAADVDAGATAYGKHADDELGMFEDRRHARTTGHPRPIDSPGQRAKPNRHIRMSAPEGFVSVGMPNMPTAWRASSDVACPAGFERVQFCPSPGRGSRPANRPPSYSAPRDCRSAKRTPAVSRRIGQRKAAVVSNVSAETKSASR